MYIYKYIYIYIYIIYIYIYICNILNALNDSSHEPLTHILKSQIAKYTDSVEVTIPGTFFFLECVP